VTFPLLLDQGIPRTACSCLRERGFEAIHVFQLGMSRSSDRQILDYARGRRMAVVTLDADFHTLLAVGNESSPSVIRIRREGLRGEALAELVASVWPKIGAQVEAGAMVTVTDNSIRMRCLPLVQVGEASDQA